MVFIARSILVTSTDDTIRVSVCGLLLAATSQPGAVEKSKTTHLPSGRITESRRSPPLRVTVTGRPRGQNASQTCRPACRLLYSGFQSAPGRDASEGVRYRLGRDVYQWTADLSLLLAASATCCDEASMHLDEPSQVAEAQ